jgi:hypothetical protein
MTVNVMLTLDLNGNVSADAREKFYAVLKAEHFKRRKLTTTWSARFTPQTTRKSAEEYLKKILVRAAAASGVRNYEVAYMFSDAEMIEHSSLNAANGLLGGLSRFS